MSDFHYRYIPGKRPETLLLFHGTGGNESGLLELGAAILPGAAVLSPRGKVLENGMPRFFRRFAEGVFDAEDVKARAAELGAFIADKSREYGRDPARLMALGYSNGANIAAAMLLTGAARFTRAVLLRSMPALVPTTFPDLSGVEVLIAAGANDPIARPEHVAQLRGLLEKAGATVAVHTANSGHELTHGDIEAATKWLARP